MREAFGFKPATCHFNALHGLEIGRDGIVAITNGLVTRAFPRDESKEIGADIIVARTAGADAVQVGVAHPAVIIDVFDHSRAVIPFAVHEQALIITARGVIGIPQPASHGEQRAILVAHATIGPEVTDIPIGEFAFDARERDGDGFQSRDEVHEVNIVASDIGERVRRVAGKPILEIGVTIVIRLDQFGLAHDEFAKATLGILAFRHQRAAVESFVIFDSHKEAALQRQFLDVAGLLGISIPAV